MKGKLKGLLLGVLCVCLTTGCVKHNVSMEVKDDKSVTLEMLYGMEIDTSAFGDDNNSDLSEDDSQESGGVDAEEYKFLEKAGYKVEEFSETTDEGTTLAGVKVTKTFDNIDDITADKESKINLVSEFNEESDKLNDLKFFYKDGNSYVTNFYFDYEAEDDEVDAEQMDAIFDLKYTLKLSSKAKENNATNVDEENHEYTWKLKYSKKNDINVKFNLGSSNSMTYVIIAAAAVLVVGAAVGITLVLKKKKTVTNNMNENVVSTNQSEKTE